MSNNLPYKMSWENYKKSEFYKNPQNPSSEIRDIYKLQSEIERKKFNVKYFNTLDKSKQNEIADAEIARQLTSAYIESFLQPALDKFSEDFKKSDKQKSGTYSGIQQCLVNIARGVDSGINVESEVNNLKQILKKAEEFISYEMPAEMAGVLKSSGSKQDLAAMNLDTASLVQGNKAAMSSYMNILQTYKDIESFVDSGMKGNISIGRGSYNFENFVTGGTKITDPKTGKTTFKQFRKNEISSRFGGFLGQITGQIFETITTKKMAEALMEVATVSNVGAKTTDAGTKQKDDLEIELNGEKLNVSMANIMKAANSNVMDEIVFNENIITGLSAKKKEMKKSNITFLQTSFQKFIELYILSGGSSADDYALTLRHAIQLGASKSETSDINKYIAAKASNLVLGDTVDFMIFLDVVIPKYEFLNVLGSNKRRWLYFDYKSKGYTENPDSVMGEVKN